MVSVGARAFDVLLALAERPGELVTKQQLFDLAWPGLVVEENNLQVQIANLRKLLGAQAIATVPGLGYRLALEPEAGSPVSAEVLESALESENPRTQMAAAVDLGPVLGSDPGRPSLTPHSDFDVAHRAEATRLRLPVERTQDRREAPTTEARHLSDPPANKGLRPAGNGKWFALGAIALLVVAAWWRLYVPQAARPEAPEAQLRSVMVAPFTAEPEDAELGREAQRLTKDVTRALGDSVREARVVPPPAAATIAAKASDIRAMEREANVRFVIEGELQPSGSNIVVTLRLFDARAGRQLATERRSMQRAQVAEDHYALVRLVTETTRAMFWAGVNQTMPKVDEATASAQDMIDRIRFLPRRDEVADTKEILRLANAAIRKDPNLAIAYARRADATIGLLYNDFDFTGDRESTLAAADADSLSAVALSDRDPSIWVMRGRVLGARGLLEGALTANDRAQQLDPTLFGAVEMRGWLYFVGGRDEDALTVADGLPESMSARRWGLACAAQVQLGTYDLAVKSCERAAARYEGWLIYANLAAAYAMHGDAAKAAQAKAKLLAIAPSFTISRYEAKRHFITPDAIARDRANMIPALRKAGVPE